MFYLLNDNNNHHPYFHHHYNSAFQRPKDTWQLQIKERKQNIYKKKEESEGE